MSPTHFSYSTSCPTKFKFKMAGRRQALQNNPDLQRFVLDGVRPTGRQLGVGSYGSVEELEMNGLMCAGKRLHEALLEQDNAGVDEIARRYLLECQVTSKTAVDIRLKTKDTLLLRSLVPRPFLVGRGEEGRVRGIT